MELFGLDIAQLVADNLGDSLPEGVLKKKVAGGRDPDDSTKQLPSTYTNHTCAAFRDDYDEGTLGATAIRREKSVISIIGDTIEGGVVPHKGDIINLEGEDWTIDGVPGRDPAGAVYECEVS